MGSDVPMESTERVTVRLSSDTLAVLRTLVDSGEYQNLSEILREAIEDFISIRFTPDNISKILVEIPKKRATELENLVKEGDAVSMDDAVRNAVTEYIRSKMRPEDRD
ncbi:MAG: ribbon-helix-helix domain-containing protein [Candidatus Methanomethylophilaceae archaeon]|jgi:Arc/MetJ-type ribon-helix-helix transcriptional regulator|nr:ribbon-helix-helix domain-containing protein [Candidatus Methanomethylophilaceae archaeon]MDD3987200.1 ribbon-helix-helix domain-containing protein [Candidatus Methanomethylophilaceae archaeon]MDD4709280.1 ribbon-helix-helix domain-containing protein [Candidatus Methanomethylophilaceae archaeon]MDY0252101.1 ribbon-helix-helix domain-containing protein [Candidatus Methanomethylophilaceae archaeon]NCA74422.1 ribbon-helix-helix protein, CopG family [Gammaproteobacteria bacterium]